MAKVIITKYPAYCSQCLAYLPSGSEARYYGKNGIYGTKCHKPNWKPFAQRSHPEQAEREAG